MHREDASLLVPLRPELREGELDERHRISHPAKLGRQGLAHGVTVEGVPVASERLVEHIDPSSSGERMHHEHRAREVLAEPRNGEQRVEEVTPHRDDEANPGGGSLGETRDDVDDAREIAARMSDDLLELIQQHDESAALTLRALGEGREDEIGVGARIDGEPGCVHEPREEIRALSRRDAEGVPGLGPRAQASELDRGQNCGARKAALA